MITPYYQAVPVGRIAVLKCHSASPPKWSIDPDIMFKTQPAQYSYTIDNSIYITSTHKDYAGRFYCNGTYPNGTFFQATAGLYIASKWLQQRICSRNTIP